MRKQLWNLVVIVLAAAILGACSKKGTGDGSGSTTTPSGNWDSIVWDQGNWS